MVIRCQCTACGYNKGKFCRNRLIHINVNGICSRLLRKDFRDIVEDKFLQGYRKCQQESQDIDQKDQVGIGQQQKDGQQKKQMNIEVTTEKQE